MTKRYDNASGWHGLYDSARWKAIRRQQLNNEPLCAMCTLQGLITLASVVDHIKPHKGDESLFYDSDNLQSLCKQHHDSAKQRQERSGLMPGADVQGIPIDKTHHWHR